MKKQPADVELRNVPKRPFGVYALVTILLLGVIAATLEIVQVETELSGFWATAASLLRDYSGLVSLVVLLFDEPTAVIVVNSLIIIVWMLVIVGMWRTVVPGRVSEMRSGCW